MSINNFVTTKSGLCLKPYFIYSITSCHLYVTQHILNISITKTKGSDILKAHFYKRLHTNEYENKKINRGLNYKIQFNSHFTNTKQYNSTSFSIVITVLFCCELHHSGHPTLSMTTHHFVHSVTTPIVLLRIQLMVHVLVSDYIRRLP